MSDNKVELNNNEELNKNIENQENDKDVAPAVSKEEIEKRKKLKKKNDIISLTVGVLAIIGVIVSAIMKHR